MTATTKTTFVNIRLDSVDTQTLDRLCNRPGEPKLSRSQAIRWLIRQAAETYLADSGR